MKSYSIYFIIVRLPFLICKEKAVVWLQWINEGQFYLSKTLFSSQHWAALCLSFDQLIYPIICLNRLFEQIPYVSESEIHIFSSIELKPCAEICVIWLESRPKRVKQKLIWFIQTTGQAVMDTFYCSKLEHSLSANLKIAWSNISCNCVITYSNYNCIEYIK